MRPATSGLTLAPLLLCAALFSGPARAAATSMAVLPAAVAGEATTRDDLDRLDAAVRQALAAWPDATVLDAATTNGALSSAESMGGARCDRSLVACQAELGALLGVAQVVDVQAVRKAGAYELSLTLVDVARAERTRAAQGRAVIDDAQLAKDVDVVVAAMLEGRAPPPVAAAVVVAAAPELIVEAAAPSPAPDPAPPLGTTVMIGGGVVAGAGVLVGIGAVACAILASADATSLQTLARAPDVATKLDDARDLRARAVTERDLAWGLGAAAVVGVVVGAGALGVGLLVSE